MQTMPKPTEPLNMQLSVKLYGIPSDDIDFVWDDVLPFVEKALSRDDGKWTVRSIKESLEQEQTQLFVVIDDEIIAIIITQITPFPGKKVLTIKFASGRDIDRWVHLINHFEQWAREKNCQSVEVWGREGWERMLNYERVGVILRKSL